MGLTSLLGDAGYEMATALLPGFFAVLGLPADSDDDTIRRRYLELVKQFSPERHPDKFAAVCVVDPSIRGSETRLAHWVNQGCRGLRLRPRILAEAEDVLRVA